MKGKCYRVAKDVRLTPLLIGERTLIGIQVKTVIFIETPNHAVIYELEVIVRYHYDRGIVHHGENLSNFRNFMDKFQVTDSIKVVNPPPEEESDYQITRRLTSETEEELFFQSKSEKFIHQLWKSGLYEFTCWENGAIINETLSMDLFAELENFCKKYTPVWVT